MFALYSKKTEEGRLKLKLEEEISLFGCRVGYIPKLLGKVIPAGQEEPFKWHLPIQHMLAERVLERASEECQGLKPAIIIDIKPRNKKEKYVTLCELLDVWGYSSSGWTPILMRLRGLLIDADPNKYEKSHLELDAQDNYDIIYTLLHLSGSVSKGRLVGTWNPPGPSPTNSVLLWPDTLKYFMECIKENDPKLLL